MKRHILLTSAKHKHLFDITHLASPLKRTREPERTYNDDDDDLESNSDSDCIDPAMWSPKRGCNNFQKAILLKKAMKTPKTARLRLDRLGLKTPSVALGNGKSGLENEVAASPLPIVVDRVSPSTVAVMGAAIHRRETHLRASGRLPDSENDIEMADASALPKLSQSSPQVVQGLQASFKATRHNTSFTILEQSDTDAALQIMQQEASLVKVTTQTIIGTCDAIAVEYEEDKENTPPEGHGFSRQHVTADAKTARQIKAARRNAIKMSGGERAAMGDLEIEMGKGIGMGVGVGVFTTVKEKETRSVMHAAAKRAAESFGFCVDEEEL